MKKKSQKKWCKFNKWVLLVTLLFTSKYIPGQNVFSDINRLQHIRAISYQKGQDFKHWVNEIAMDQNDLLWITSHNLLYTFDGVTISERASVENYGDFGFRSIYVIKDTIYLKRNVTDLHYYPIYSTDNVIKKARWNHDISSHCSNEEERDFIATKEGRVLEYKKGKFKTIFETTSNKDKDQYNASRNALIVDANASHILWFYHKNNLFRINLKDGTSDNFNCYNEAGIDLNYIHANASYSADLLQMGEYIFLGSVQNGLIGFHIPSKTWSSHTRDVPVEFEGREDHINSVISIEAINDSLLILGGTFAPFFNIKRNKEIQYLGSERNYSLFRQGSSIKCGDIFFLSNFNGGVSVLNSNNNLFSNFEAYREEDFYPSSKDSNGLSWSCDGEQIYAVNSSTDTLERINILSLTNEKLSENLLLDAKGYIWLGSSTGLIRYNISKGTFRRFTSIHGLPSGNWNKNFKILQNKKGRILIRSDELNSLFHPDALVNDHQVKKPRVSKVTVLDQSHFNFKNQSIKLKPEEDFFSIQYSSFNYNADPYSVYEYKLEGYDQDWVKGHKEKSVSYNYLSPGTYTFKIKLTNQEGNQVALSDDFNIKVMAHWYESLLFKLIIGFLLLLTTYTFYRVKTSSLKRELSLREEFNEELTQIKSEALRSQMNPHFLFNCLNSIDNFILSNDIENASKYLGKFSKLIRNILDYSKTNAITLEQELQSTEIYLKMEQMRFKEKFTYEINISPKINQQVVVIPPLILQPYIENSIWHGLLHKDQKGSIKINIDTDKDHYIIEIEDDGIGREKALAIKSKSSTNRKSYGMKITEDRIRLINQLKGRSAKVKTIDKIDEYNNAAGTKVILILPMN